MTKIASFPHEYDVSVLWQGRREGVTVAAPRPSIVGGPPPQFGGSDLRWSPEEQLLSSVGLCFLTTFFTLVERDGLDVGFYRSFVHGTLDRTAAGLAFTSLRLEVHLGVAADERVRAERLLATAKRGCIIANSLKAEVHLETSFVSGEHDTASVTA